MRFEVPQFIEVEDKIIGPFTWKQFVYLAGGAGAVLVLFFTLPFFLFVILGVPIAGLAGFLAFHRVNSRPFSEFLESVFNYMTGSRLYLWKKQQANVVTRRAEEQAEAAPVAAQLPTPTRSNIASLSRKLELEALKGGKQ